MGWKSNILVLFAAFCTIANGQNVSGCQKKKFTVDWFGTVRAKCPDSGSICLECTKVLGVEEKCKPYKDYLVNCLPARLPAGSRFHLRLHKENLAGFMPKAFDNGLSNAYLIQLGSETGKIRSFPAGLLDKLPNLEEVTITGSFSTLPKDFFKNNGNISKLTINAPIRPSSLPVNVLTLPKLTMFFMHNWNVNFMTASPVKDVPGLKILYIDGGVTSFKSTALSYHPKLTELYIARNPKLTTLSSELLSKLPKLRLVRLSENGLTKLSSKFFEKNPALSTINLRDNSLASLPEKIFAMQTGLSSVNIALNNLERLPANLLANNTKLVELWAEHNQLTTLSSKLFSGKSSLKYIYLQQNSLDKKKTSSALFQALPALQIVTIEPQGNGSLTCSHFNLPKGAKCL